MITTFEIITINLVAIYYHGNMRGRWEIVHSIKTARYCSASVVIIERRCARLNIRCTYAYMTTNLKVINTQIFPLVNYCCCD